LDLARASRTLSEAPVWLSLRKCIVDSLIRGFGYS
jgi:hypothetical protein